MPRRQGAYTVLKGMDMSVPGVVNDADSANMPEHQMNETPIKVTSSIRLQPVNTSSGVQLQSSPAQKQTSSNVSTKKITKISVQHQSGGQTSPQVQQFQQTSQFPQSSQQGTPIQIQRQTAVQQRQAQLQSNPKVRQRPQLQQQQQQQPEQKASTTTIRLQQPNQQPAAQSSISGYQPVQFSQQPTSYQPQEYNPQPSSGYQAQQYNQQPTSQFSAYQPAEASQPPWSQVNFQPESNLPPSEVQNDPNDFNFPPVSQLSKRFQEAKPEPKSYNEPAPGTSFQSGSTWQTPSSPRAGRRQFPASAGQQQHQQQSAPSFGTQYTKPAVTASSPKVVRKLPPKQQQPQSSPTFGSQYSRSDSNSEPLWQPAPEFDSQAPSLASDYTVTKSTISAEERERWEPKSAKKLPTSRHVDQVPLVWHPSKPPASGGQKAQQPKPVPVSTGPFASPKPLPVEKPKRPKSQPDAIIPLFGADYERRGSGGSSRPPRPPSQPQPAVPAFGTQYGDPPTGSVVQLKRQPSAESPTFGTQYVKPTPQPYQQPTPVNYQYNQDIGFSAVRQPSPPVTSGAPQSAPKPTIPSFGAQYTPKAKPAQQSPAGQGQQAQRPSGAAQAKAPPPSDFSSSFGVVFTPKDEEQIREEVERKRKQMEQQEASTCPWTVDDIKNRVSKLRSDLFVARDENQELHEEMRKLNRILNELKVQYEYSEKQKQALEYKASELSDQVDDLKSKQTASRHDLLTISNITSLF